MNLYKNTMIRSLFILTVLSFTLISCKKDYTCSCVQTIINSPKTQNANSLPESTIINNNSHPLRAKKGEAESKCKIDEMNTTETFGSGNNQRVTTETVTCELK